MSLVMGRMLTIKPDGITDDGISARKLEPELFCETFQMSASPWPISEPEARETLWREST
jgi:hypothetical protein